MSYNSGTKKVICISFIFYRLFKFDNASFPQKWRKQRYLQTWCLLQVYQITYITLKAANSPRPGAWILERSLDGIVYQPWQYFARNDRECLEMFEVPATKGKPQYSTDTEVICTSFYSRLTPLENGEVMMNNKINNQINNNIIFIDLHSFSTRPSGGERYQSRTFGIHKGEICSIPFCRIKG